MKRLRRLYRDFAEGLRAGTDVLLWGHAYPSRYDLRQSIVPPTSAQLPEALRRVERELRHGQPDIHQGRRT